jgi:hypothetical protein
MGFLATYALVRSSTGAAIYPLSPIDTGSSVPTAILAAAARTQGFTRTAKAYAVQPAAVKRAMAFEEAPKAVLSLGISSEVEMADA